MILVPCKAYLNRSIFEPLAYFKRSLTGSVSPYISSVQGSLKVLFSGLSSLFLRSVTFFPFFKIGWILFPVVRVEVSGGGYLPFCNLFLNLTCHLIVHYGDAVSIWQLICILPWVSGISRTVNFGGLHLVFSGHISIGHLWGRTWGLIH